MTMIKGTAVTTYAASGSALIFGLNAEVFAALAGVAIAFVAMVANIWLTWHFKREHLRLASEQARRDSLVHNEDRGDE
jgi:divalent metal cation (Fe/Co/Zn/Cd) transporter